MAYIRFFCLFFMLLPYGFIQADDRWNERDLEYLLIICRISDGVCDTVFDVDRYMECEVFRHIAIDLSVETLPISDTMAIGEVASRLNVTTSKNVGQVLWSNGMEGKSIVVSPCSTTTYKATAYSKLCPDLIAETEVTLIPTWVPIAGFDFNVNAFTANFTNTTTDATTYSWNFGDGNYSTQASPSHTFPGPGTYTVTLTATSGGCSDQISKEITITSVGVNEQNWIRDFGIYPNPSNGWVTVSLQLEKELRVQLTVYNTMGQQLFSKDLGMLNKSVQNFDFSDLPSGSYMMQLMMDDQTVVKQMVIF